MAVILGSIPFVVFLTWKAKIFGISRTRAFSITFLLSCAVLMFPWALRSGWATWWILSVIILIISGMLLIKIQFNESAIGNKDLGYINKSEEELKIEEVSIMEERPVIEEASIMEERSVIEEASIMEERPVIEETSITEERPIIEETPIMEEKTVIRDKPKIEEEPKITEGTKVDIQIDNTLENAFTIDQLIDLGFKEKDSENFRQAADYFSRALALEPMPDLAFYLIVDCYWLLNNLEERDNAFNELKGYIQIYLSQFNPELRHRFDAWMTKENLNKYFND